MSELKVYKIMGIEFDSQFYHKSEADKVIAELETNLSEIQSQKMQLEDDVALLRRNNAELKDKCQMHDFFWEGCGFAKRGFKNSIAVREAFDKLEAENESLLQQNRELCQALQVMYSKEEYDKQKYKRCLAMAKWCEDRWADIATPYFKSVWYRKWQLRWLELAEKFKEAK